MGCLKRPLSGSAVEAEILEINRFSQEKGAAGRECFRQRKSSMFADPRVGKNMAFIRP